MKVKELIELLKKQDPDMQVATLDDSQSCFLIEVQNVFIWDGFLKHKGPNKIKTDVVIIK